MYSAGDFRNGVTFEWDGNVYTVVEFQHVKPGKGAAFVRTKIKNVITGGVIEHSFSPTEKFPQAFIERKDMEYLYNDGDFPTTSSLLRKMLSLRSFPIRAKFSALSLPHLLNLPLPSANPA